MWCSDRPALVPKANTMLLCCQTVATSHQLLRGSQSLQHTLWVVQVGFSDIWCVVEQMSDYKLLMFEY